MNSEPSISGGTVAFNFEATSSAVGDASQAERGPQHCIFFGWKCEPRSYDHTRFVVLELLSKTGISPKILGSPMDSMDYVEPTYWIMKSTRTSLNLHQYWIHTYVILCPHNNMNMNNYIWMNHVSNARMRFVLNNVYI